MGKNWKSWMFLLVIMIFLLCCFIVKLPNSALSYNNPDARLVRKNSTRDILQAQKIHRNGNQDLHKTDSSRRQRSKGQVSIGVNRTPDSYEDFRLADKQSSSHRKEFPSALKLASVVVDDEEEVGSRNSSGRNLQKARQLQNIEDVSTTGKGGETRHESADVGTWYPTYPHKFVYDSNQHQAPPVAVVQFNYSLITNNKLRNLHLNHRNFLQTDPPTYLPNFRNPCWNETYEGGTFRIRCIPYFYLAGFPKCGTTDLFWAIMKHPQISLSKRKEPHWWTRGRFVRKNFQSYLEFFDEASSHVYRNKNSDGLHPGITGEGSASTLWDVRFLRYPENINKSEPEVLLANELHHLNPHTKIIISVRNPTPRLYSDYLYFTKTGDNPDIFHDLAKADLQTMQSCLLNNTERHCVYNLQAKFRTRLHIGMYAVYIEDWLRVFPRDQIHILRLEDYAQDKQQALNEIFEFLQLPQVPSGIGLFDERTKKNSRRKLDASKGPMLQNTREMLNDFYRPYNTRLAHLLGDERYLWFS